MKHELGKRKQYLIDEWRRTLENRKEESEDVIYTKR